MRICTKVHNALTRANNTFPHIPKHPKNTSPHNARKNPPKKPEKRHNYHQNPCAKDTNNPIHLKNLYKTPEKHLKINFYRLILSHHYSPITQNAKTPRLGQMIHSPTYRNTQKYPMPQHATKNTRKGERKKGKSNQPREQYDPHHTQPQPPHHLPPCPTYPHTSPPSTTTHDH